MDAPRIEYAHNLDANSNTHLLCRLDSVMVFCEIKHVDPQHNGLIRVHAIEPASGQSVRETLAENAICLVAEIDPDQARFSKEIRNAEEIDDPEEDEDSGDILDGDCFNLVLLPGARRSLHVIKLIRAVFNLGLREARDIVFDAPLPWTHDKVFTSPEATSLLSMCVSDDRIPAGAITFKPVKRDVK